MEDNSQISSQKEQIMGLYGDCVGTSQKIHNSILPAFINRSSYQKIINAYLYYMHKPDIVITQTQKWINDVVIGCNFCPFAAREVKKGSIRYEVAKNETPSTTLNSLLSAFQLLDSNPTIETLLLITPEEWGDFDEYLRLITSAERLLRINQYEGVYQIATFHPQYIFEGSDENDPSNYTNRSPYPMLHLLREESLSKAIDSYGNTEDIPEANIAFTKKKGLEYMKVLRDACMKNVF